MWLRLAYLNLPTAFKRIQTEGRPLKAAISGRYKQVLKKQFYIHGLPWIYERPLNADINPRHKKPKGHRSELKRLERVERIKTALISMPDEELKFRQERLNKRPLKGMDKYYKQIIRIVQKTLPSWISMRKIGDGPVEVHSQFHKQDRDEDKEQRRQAKELGFDD